MISVHCSHPRAAVLRLGGGAVLGLGMVACVAPPPRTVAVPVPPPQRVFVYPSNGQSPEQTDRDRYECHVWAVQQTGVDPSRADAGPMNGSSYSPPRRRVRRLLRARLAAPSWAPSLRVREMPAQGFVLGAASGAIVGSAVDANNQAQAHQTQGKSTRRPPPGRARADSYRRALGACLQGRAIRSASPR